MLPVVDNDVDLSEVQDQLNKAQEGVPFRITSHGVERIFQKLVKSRQPSFEKKQKPRKASSIGVVYQTSDPLCARMLRFGPLALKI